MGTFALAMAFAGNDLVDHRCAFGCYSAFQDFTANSAGECYRFMMGSLNGSANFPVVCLFAADCYGYFSAFSEEGA